MSYVRTRRLRHTVQSIAISTLFLRRVLISVAGHTIYTRTIDTVFSSSSVIPSVETMKERLEVAQAIASRMRERGFAVQVLELARSIAASAARMTSSRVSFLPARMAEVPAGVLAVRRNMVDGPKPGPYGLWLAC